MSNALKKILIGTSRQLSRFSLLAALTLLPTACVDEVYSPTAESEIVYSPDANGMYGPFTLTIPLDAAGYEVHARSSFETSNLEITSYWAAIFDATTGKLVGMTSGSYNDVDAPSADHNGGVGSQYAIKFDNLMFNDENPKVYIAGAVNYEDIDAVDAYGNHVLLKTALDSVKTIKEYKNISVNCLSADTHSKKASGENRPLMAGFWGAGHSNFTVDLSGKVHINASGSATTAEVQLFDSTTKKVTDSFKNTIANGKIHLRRLFSHINVTTTIDMSQFQAFDVQGIEVCNVPQYTFLQEHKTVEDATKYNHTTWVDSISTHTAADLFGVDGYKNYELPSSSTVETGAFSYIGDDPWKVTDSGNTRTLKFGYWHYEQKHWGLPSVKTLNDRERMFEDGSGVYSSLCTESGKDFNNNAAYFVIKAYVESKDGTFKGNARFVVHEGYACKADGDASTDLAVVSRDFSTFRNTNYNYTVKIDGSQHLSVKVTASDLTGDFNHGTGGELWSTTTKALRIPKEGASLSLRLPKGKVFWAIKDNQTGEVFGVPMDNDWEYASRYSAYPEVNSSIIPADNDFYNNVKLDGRRLDLTTTVSDESRQVSLQFPYNATSNCTLYLCCIYDSPDKTTSYYAVYELRQNGLLLDTPKVTMPNAPVGTNDLVIGLDDHTIFITPIAEAERYRIELVKVSDGKETVGGYTVTLAPGETHTDSDNYQTTLVRESDGRLSFRMRYANSQSALMNLVKNNLTQIGTIRVTAVGDNGKESDPVDITRNFINPKWDFTGNEWKNAVQTLLHAATGKFPVGASVRVNGLSANAGESDKFEYMTAGTNYMGFRPNGAGSTKKSNFTFHAFAKGQLQFRASAASTTVNQGRYITVALDGNTSTVLTTADATTSKDGVPTLLDKMANVDAKNLSSTVDNIHIYSTGDIKFYSIQFTPQDR